MFQVTKEVFLKDMPHRFKMFVNNMDEVIPSMIFELSGFFSTEASWCEQEEVYNWITGTKGCEPLVMDADDLQKDPGQNFFSRSNFTCVIMLCEEILNVFYFLACQTFILCLIFLLDLL